MLGFSPPPCSFSTFHWTPGLSSEAFKYHSSSWASPGSVFSRPPTLFCSPDVSASHAPSPDHQPGLRWTWPPGVPQVPHAYCPTWCSSASFTKASASPVPVMSVLSCLRRDPESLASAPHPHRQSCQLPLQCLLPVPPALFSGCRRSLHRTLLPHLGHHGSPRVVFLDQLRSTRRNLLEHGGWVHVPYYKTCVVQSKGQTPSWAQGTPQTHSGPRHSLPRPHCGHSTTGPPRTPGSSSKYFSPLCLCSCYLKVLCTIRSPSYPGEALVYLEVQLTSQGVSVSSGGGGAPGREPCLCLHLVPGTS